MTTRWKKNLVSSKNIWHRNDEGYSGETCCCIIGEQNIIPLINIMHGINFQPSPTPTPFFNPPLIQSSHTPTPIHIAFNLTSDHIIQWLSWNRNDNNIRQNRTKKGRQVQRTSSFNRQIDTEWLITNSWKKKNAAAVARYLPFAHLFS